MANSLSQKVDDPTDSIIDLNNILSVLSVWYEKLPIGDLAQIPFIGVNEDMINAYEHINVRSDYAVNNVPENEGYVIIIQEVEINDKLIRYWFKCTPHDYERKEKKMERLLVNDNNDGKSVLYAIDYVKKTFQATYHFPTKGKIIKTFPLGSKDGTYFVDNVVLYEGINEELHYRCVLNENVDSEISKMFFEKNTKSFKPSMYFQDNKANKICILISDDGSFLISLQHGLKGGQDYIENYQGVISIDNISLMTQKISEYFSEDLDKGFLEWVAKNLELFIQYLNAKSDDDSFKSGNSFSERTYKKGKPHSYLA